MQRCVSQTLSIQRCARQARNTQHRASYSTTTAYHPVPALHDGSLATFREQAFVPAKPFLAPRGHFNSIPAIQKWFQVSSDSQHTRLNKDHLSRYQDAIVPLEITHNGNFTQIHESLGFFIEAASQRTSKARIYLAQASLSDLPDGLREDVPTPDLVLKAGKGDIYDTSIWLGRAPTYTPLHRDPNPNLFVQLAGTKRVRLFRPDVGGAIFAHAQQMIGGNSNAIIRGAEMMQGREKEVLEELVWGDEADAPWQKDGFECSVESGDGLFIPKGWWHSIKGIGHGMTGSVNWWFR